jgi:hypothetical protein
MITAREKLACAERELRFRRRVYAKRVAAGLMSASQANYELNVMEHIAEDYRELAKRQLELPLNTVPV